MRWKKVRTQCRDLWAWNLLSDHPALYWPGLILGLILGFLISVSWLVLRERKTRGRKTRGRKTRGFAGS